MDFDDLKENNIYTDLLREFVEKGHCVNIISPTERRKKNEEKIIHVSGHCTILKLKIGNVQKTNTIEKGISTITIEKIFLKGIKKYFPDIKFNLVLYSTPPVTFQKVVLYVKKRDGAKSYLLLKDIFPQNAVDLGKFSEKGLIYYYFRKKEVALYKISDFIGTMSEENTNFLLTKNNFINKNKVEVNPNSVKINESKVILNYEKEKIRSGFGIDNNDLFLLYGGNLGAPQGIDFLLHLVNELERKLNIFLLIVGSGTEYKKIEYHISNNQIKNTNLIPYLPKEEYIKIEQSADVGLIFLDSRFTVPNIPSRMLGYLQAGLPILAATDSHTDLKEIISIHNFGRWSLHGNLSDFLKNIDVIKEKKIRAEMSHNGIKYLKKFCNVVDSYNLIMSHFS